MLRDKYRVALFFTVFAVLALLIAACGGSAPAKVVDQAAQEVQEAAVTEVSGRCGDPGKLDDTLNFYNWADYIDENIITMFEEECGVDVTMDLYTSNEEAIAKIQAGNSGYDLSIPTDYAAKILIDEGLVQPLDMSIIPNAKNLKADNLGQYYDPDNTYSLPYQWSTTGIAYNASAFDEPPTSYAAVFESDQVCAHSGFVSMLDDQRETIGMALQYLGYSANETDPAAHKQALQLLLRQKGCIAGYNSENFIQTLAAEEVEIAGSWGFAAALAYFDNENIRYFIPEEGGIIWQDNMVVIADAPHPYTAHVFINYLLEPDIGAMLTEFTVGFTPNAAVEPLLSDDYKATIETVGLTVDDNTRSRMEWVLRGEGAGVFADTWTAVKARDAIDPDTVVEGAMAGEGKEVPAEFGRCGDPSKLTDTLNFYNWADYIDEDIITMFEEECGVDVTMDLYTSNEEAIAKIQAGNSGYDLSIPTDYAAKILIDEGLVKPLDMSAIPNAKNLKADNLGQYYDPDNTYSLPYQWSTTGIAYNASAFPDPPTSYAAIFDQEQVCAHKGFVSMLDDQRETVGMALQYLGYSANETDPKAHEEALALLREQKECITAYNSENFIQTLAAEEVEMAGSWGFAAALAYFENENIRYFIPAEGGIIWQDNMVVIADAPHPYTAHVFINYLLEPDIGAMLTEWTVGFTPNAAVEPLLSDDYKTTIETVGLTVDDNIRSRLEWVLRGEGAGIFADTWTSLKAE